MGQLPEGDPAPEHGLLSEAEIEGHSQRTFHAYVHIPFCATRCGYCDFNTYTATELGELKQSEYARSLISEIAFSAEVLDRSRVKPRELTTVFFGGGTPTLLPAVDLVVMLDSLRNQFGISPDAEVTVEANPDTINREKLQELKEAGFNRLSIGMQSADRDVLVTLERSHNPENVSIAIDLAKEYGFQTSLDLIFGAPGESIEQWEASLSVAINLEPDHISAYSLIVEPGTKLFRQISSGVLKGVDEDLQADKYELADALLTEAGYDWYEISNFAKTPSNRSRHNLAYWLGQDWWGYGPGAHSHLGSVRWWNQKHPATYAQRLANFQSPTAGREKIDNATNRLERVLLESRLSDGMSIESLRALNPQLDQPVSELIADGLIDGRQALAGRVVLTRRGRLLADAVVRKLTD